MLHMQGIQFDMDVLYLFDEHKLGDLAGNAQLAERDFRIKLKEI